MSLKEVLKQLGIKLIGWVKSNCVNNLLSDRADLPLAAAQGKALDGKITALNSNINTINTNVMAGKNALDNRAKDITVCALSESDKWAYYNANDGATNLPAGEVWGFAKRVAFGSFWIIIFVSGRSGKIYHTVYNSSTWSAWYPH